MDAERRKLVFQTLQPVFSRLLDHGLSAQQLARLFREAEALLQRDILLRQHVHLCLDYLLFPFQFMLASITASRRASGDGQSSAMGGTAAGASMPALASPLAAERALQCLCLLLELAPLQTVQQVTGITALLVEVLHLPPAPATNEQMVLCAMRAVRRIHSSASALVRAAYEQAQEWHVTSGYLVHGLLAVASRETHGTGFGALVDHLRLPADVREARHLSACMCVTCIEQQRSYPMSGILHLSIDAHNCTCRGMWCYHASQQECRHARGSHGGTEDRRCGASLHDAEARARRIPAARHRIKVLQHAAAGRCICTPGSHHSGQRVGSAGRDLAHCTACAVHMLWRVSRGQGRRHAELSCGDRKLARRHA